jgi:signal transduction histidine kinase/ActR/RegA family two-component response regulator
VPVVALVLTVVAIASVWVLVQRADASRASQLRISAVELSVADLEVAPNSADPATGGSPSAGLARIRRDDQAIARGLRAGVQAGVPTALLVGAQKEFAAMAPPVAHVYYIATHGGLAAGGRILAAFEGPLLRHAVALIGVLHEISGDDATRAATARERAEFGSTLAMLLLLVAFAFFYFRSTAARAAVEIARDDAVEASNAKSMFIATVSHELRTPLTGIIGMSELLLDSKLDASQHEHAHMSLTAAEGLLLVINDILDYSKIEAGKIELDPSSFSLRETVAEACAMLLLATRDKGIELAVETEASLPTWLYGDGARLRQVILNLVSNAVKFTDSGNVAVRVHATPLNGSTRVRIEVTDTGIGITQEALARLFQPFTQADSSTARRYGGTGLGLSISARLIEAMGGTIGASSEVGTGSTFWFEVTLPAANATDHLGPPSASLDMLHAWRGDRAPLILVVEDNPVNQIIAVRVLEAIGCDSEIVSDGRDALAAIEQTNYAAVLMDCQMPGMDGYEATKQIRRRERGSEHLAIIAMTAHSMPGDGKKCLAAGMDDYLSKPIRAGLLKETIARLMAAPPGHAALKTTEHT